MAWEQRFLSQTGAPAGWRSEGNEKEKFGSNLDLGDEKKTGLKSSFGRGSVLRPMAIQSSIRVGASKDAPTAWDDRDWTGEFLSLLEAPLFTPQDVRTKMNELKDLRHAFVKRHFRMIKVLVQERIWAYHYKTLKPIVSTSTYFGYVANNAFFKVQHDTKGRFLPDGMDATREWLNQEMRAAANATECSQTNVSSPLMAMVDWCGVRILLCSVIPGAPWSEEHAASQKIYLEEIENGIAPTEISYQWSGIEFIERNQTDIKKKIDITPIELMQLSSGKIEYMLRIRFRIWKNQVLGIKAYRSRLLRQRDQDVLHALRDVGAYNCWSGMEKRRKKEIGGDSGDGCDSGGLHQQSGGAVSVANNNYKKKHKGNKKEEDKEFVVVGLGMDREVEILRGSDCRYYLTSCSRLLPPMAPLVSVNVIVEERRKQEEGIDFEDSEEEDMRNGRRSSFASSLSQKASFSKSPGRKINISSSNKNTVMSSLDVTDPATDPASTPTAPPPWRLPLICLVAVILPIKMSDKLELLTVPWQSTHDPRDLITFVESSIGPAHETGGFLETRDGSLLFWRGSSESNPVSNRRASKIAQRELFGGSMLLPGYTNIHMRQRWTNQSLNWRRKHLTPIHPEVFRYPIETSESGGGSGQSGGQGGRKSSVRSSPTKRRGSSILPTRRRGSNISVTTSIASLLLEKAPSVSAASRQLASETLMFLEHSVKKVVSDFLVLSFFSHFSLFLLSKKKTTSKKK